MRRSEIANLEADLQRRINVLEAKRHVAVTFEPVGAGFLAIEDVDPGQATAEPERETESVPDDVPPYEEPVQVFTG